MDEDRFLRRGASMQHSNYKTTLKHYIDHKEVAKEMVQYGFRVFPTCRKRGGNIATYFSGFTLELAESLFHFFNKLSDGQNTFTFGLSEEQMFKVLLFFIQIYCF